MVEKFYNLCYKSESNKIKFTEESFEKIVNNFRNLILKKIDTLKKDDNIRKEEVCRKITFEKSEIMDALNIDLENFE